MDSKAPNPLIAWIQSSARKSLPRAQEALIQIKEHMGEASWSQQALPWQALEKPAFLGMLLQQGLSFSRIDPHPEYNKHGIRGLALFLDAPLDTYTYLDAACIEEISEDTCSRIGIEVVRKGRVNSFRALHKAHPVFMENAVKSSPSVVCVGVMSNYLQSQSKKNLAMLRAVNNLGAHWEDLEKQRQFIDEKNRPVFEAIVRDLYAERLAEPWSQTPAPTRSRPRL
jgi:hypothetical protein